MIPVNEPLLNGNEKKYLNECIDTGWISSEGTFVKRFEENFSALVNKQHGIAVANGSVALDIAIAALEISNGDEVIMPTFTIISCAAPIVRAGAIPVLIDADPNTFNMKVEDVEGAITLKTKAIMVVHIYGIPTNMDLIMDVAKKHNLKVIEDAAEMIGHKYRGKPCGSFGDISTFSFYPNKHVTTGEGGMVVTNDEKLAQKCRELRNLCFIPPRRFIHEDLGWNFRMTNLQAALGVAQLERIDEFIAKKKQIGSWYNSLLKDIKGIKLPLESTNYADNIYWVYTIVLEDTVKFDALSAMSELAKLGIGTRPFFYPMHKQPVFNKMGLFLNDKFEVYIPSGLSLTFQQAQEVAESLKQILK
jgi:perosamine synthetase